MSSVTVRNLPDSVHRAIRMRAAQHGRSVEAEMRRILETAVKPQERIKLGSKLTEVGKKIRLSDDEFDLFTQAHSIGPARSMSFE